MSAVVTSVCSVLQLALLRKTRHENLVLFMGACMKPPRLAIVTRWVDKSCICPLLKTAKDIVYRCVCVLDGRGHCWLAVCIASPTKIITADQDKNRIVAYVCACVYVSS